MDDRVYKELRNILFLDIETVACAPNYQELDERLKKEWNKKSRFLLNNDVMTPEELFNERAGIYSEYGKIVTIGLGSFHYNDNRELSLRVKDITNDDERQVLLDFKQLLDTKFDQRRLAFCAHNGKEFDYPYITRRMLINGVKLPYALNHAGKKPWEINHIDTMDLWKFGDRKSFTSLELLAALFKIESSKSDIDGSMVNQVYYQDRDLDKIAQYCKQDIVVTAQVFLRLKSLETVKPENIQVL